MIGVCLIELSAYLIRPSYHMHDECLEYGFCNDHKYLCLIVIMQV